MTEGEAFIAILVLLGIATALSRKFLSSRAQIALGLIAAVAHLA